MAFLTRRSYKVTLPNGKIVTKQVEHYTIQYRDAAGKICRVKGYKDKGATKQLAARLERQQARGEELLKNPFEVHNATEIDSHLADYLSHLEGVGRDNGYIYNGKKRIQRIISETGWQSLKDIDANSFVLWRDAAKKNPRAVGFRKPKEGEQRTAAAETLNQYLETVRAFTNWCATTGRMPGVPSGSGKMTAIALAGVGKVDGETVRKRRALSDAEVLKLLKQAPADRSIVYRFGIATGLRRAEIEQLAWGDVRLTDKPYLQLRAETTKAGDLSKTSSIPPLFIFSKSTTAVKGQAGNTFCCQN